jgi:hypothetical protein
MVRMLRNCLQLQHEPTNAALALLLGHLAWCFGHLKVVLASMHGVLASEEEAVGGAVQDSCTVPVDCATDDATSGRSRMADDTCSTSEDMDMDCSNKHAVSDHDSRAGSMSLLVRSSETSCLLHLLTHDVSMSPERLLGSAGGVESAVVGCLVCVLQGCLEACADEREHLVAQDASSCRVELQDRIGKGCRCCAAMVLEACLRVRPTTQCPRAPFDHQPVVSEMHATTICCCMHPPYV